MKIKQRVEQMVEQEVGRISHDTGPQKKNKEPLVALYKLYNVQVSMALGWCTFRTLPVSPSFVCGGHTVDILGHFSALPVLHSPPFVWIGVFFHCCRGVGPKIFSPKN